MPASVRPLLISISHVRRYFPLRLSINNGLIKICNHHLKVKYYFGNKFSDLFKTITTDNGSEVAELSKLEESNKTFMYYSHPYASWEKATTRDISVWCSAS